jgi:hypothetical protein
MHLVVVIRRRLPSGSTRVTSVRAVPSLLREAPTWGHPLRLDISEPRTSNITTSLPSTHMFIYQICRTNLSHTKGRMSWSTPRRYTTTGPRSAFPATFKSSPAPRTCGSAARSATSTTALTSSSSPATALSPSSLTKLSPSPKSPSANMARHRRRDSRQCPTSRRSSLVKVSARSLMSLRP